MDYVKNWKVGIYQGNALVPWGGRAVERWYHK